MDKNKERDVEMPKVASGEAWLRARKELLIKEKEWNRQRKHSAWICPAPFSCAQIE